jgi:hypothetical protein
MSNAPSEKLTARDESPLFVGIPSSTNLLKPEQSFAPSEPYDPSKELMIYRIEHQSFESLIRRVYPRTSSAPRSTVAKDIQNREQYIKETF